MIGFPYLANVIRSAQLVEQRTRREAESEAAQAANEKDYKLSPESQAALERGDRQRETGVYEDKEYAPVYSYDGRECVAVDIGYGDACTVQYADGTQASADRSLLRFIPLAQRPI